MVVMWMRPHGLKPKKYQCSFCGSWVGSRIGYGGSHGRFIYVCTNCGEATYFRSPTNQIPRVPPGSDVQNLPDQVATLYREARECVAVSAYTAAVLTCRKLLMHVAVAKGAGNGYGARPCFLPTPGFASRHWLAILRSDFRRFGPKAPHSPLSLGASPCPSLLGTGNFGSCACWLMIITSSFSGRNVLIVSPITVAKPIPRVAQMAVLYDLPSIFLLSEVFSALSAIRWLLRVKFSFKRAVFAVYSFLEIPDSL